MRLGLFMMPVHPPERLLADTLAEDTEKSLLAERLGFDELWVGEHFSATSEPIPSPLMFMAGLVPRTTRLTFGTAVINITNHDPVVIAAEAAQFDHMSRGRFMLGIGPGGLLSDFELFGVGDPAARARETLESVRLIQRIWSQDPPYDIPGEFRTVRLTGAIIPELGVGFMPKPFRPGGPPISTSLASPNSDSARTAAQEGWGIISGNISPPYSVASHWAVYAQACADAGKPACGDAWRVARNVMVAPSETEARDRVFGEGASNRYFFAYMHKVLARVGLLPRLKPDPAMSDAETTPEVLAEANVIHGSPKTVLDKLVAFRERVGPFGTLLMTGLDWSGANEAAERRSMQLLAEEVMPKFRRHALVQAAE
jgi:alkanesulfonate monooxygenase SsuD/methylene tetrahydromethanopterin reductase-like flavin-dependent oxidoreductase (luciferase family)